MFLRYTSPHTLPSKKLRRRNIVIELKLSYFLKQRKTITVIYTRIYFPNVIFLFLFFCFLAFFFFLASKNYPRSQGIIRNEIKIFPQKKNGCTALYLIVTFFLRLMRGTSKVSYTRMHKALRWETRKKSVNSRKHNCDNGHRNQNKEKWS